MDLILDLNGQFQEYMLPWLFGCDADHRLSHLVCTPDDGAIFFPRETRFYDSDQHFVRMRGRECIQNSTILLKVQISVICGFENRSHRNLIETYAQVIQK
jgi:hypothetical protein